MSIEDELLIYQKLCVSFKSVPKPLKVKGPPKQPDEFNSNPKRIKVSENNAKSLPSSNLTGDEVIIGINNVTRALEKDQIRLVVVSSQANPFKVIQHIPILCTTRNIPVCKLNKSTSDLAKCFGSLSLKSVLCFGLRRVDSGTSQWNELYDFISQKALSVNIDWLPSKEVLENIEKPDYKTLKVKSVEHEYVKKKKA